MSSLVAGHDRAVNALTRLPVQDATQICGILFPFDTTMRDEMFVALYREDAHKHIARVKADAAQPILPTVEHAVAFDALLKLPPGNRAYTIANYIKSQVMPDNHHRQAVAFYKALLAQIDANGENVYHLFDEGRVNDFDNFPPSPYWVTANYGAGLSLRSTSFACWTQVQCEEVRRTLKAQGYTHIQIETELDKHRRWRDRPWQIKFATDAENYAARLRSILRGQNELTICRTRRGMTGDYQGAHMYRVLAVACGSIQDVTSMLAAYADSTAERLVIRGQDFGWLRAKHEDITTFEYETAAELTADMVRRMVWHGRFSPMVRVI